MFQAAAPFLGAMGLGAMMGGGGDVSVKTTQQVSQSVNTNVNPVIAVQTPAAHFSPSSNLGAETMQSPTSTQKDEWRTAVPGSIGLGSFQGSDSGPATAVFDNKQDGDISPLSTIFSPTMFLALGIGLFAWVMFK